MNKLFFLSLVIVALSLYSCDKDNQATLEVVNQTDCMHNVYDGVDDGGDFLGPVGANQTKSFIIELGTAERISGNYFAAEPVNCAGSFNEQFQVDISEGKTATILIN